MAIKHIIFDLDGPLIDSARSIIRSLEAALQETGLTAIHSLDASLIGPPLRDTLALISGSNDPALLDRLADAFKRHYDSAGYKAALPFSGVPKMLADLVRQDALLYIATNKRRKPTLLIIEHLGWRDYFDGIYTLDSFSPQASNKTELLTRLLSAGSVSPEHTIYVGDRPEDEDAACQNNVAFAPAYWGYWPDQDTVNGDSRVAPICIRSLNK